MPEIAKEKTLCSFNISLHDADVSGCKIEDEHLVLKFKDGFFIPADGFGVCRSGSAEVRFSGIDAEFCWLRILEKKKFREYRLSKLSKLLKKKNVSDFEIVDEYYGFSSAMFCGYFWHKKQYKRFQIEIYFTGKMIYIY